ncbi:hypothetical protein KJ780_03530 [Candidatus Micrarchaeota archaeon]|nr:hypothetical protein [Candidatus Micrarchaeota archaeon]
MEFNEMLISTGVDALIKLIREKGQVEITLASRLLNIPISTIEEWIRVLEEEGIVTVDYQLTKVYLRWVHPTHEQAASERASVIKEKEQLLQEIKRVEQKAKAQTSGLKEIKDEFSSNYTKILERIDEIGKSALSTQQVKGTGEEQYEKALDVLDEFKTHLDDLDESIKSMRSQLEKTRTEFLAFDITKQLEKLSDSKKELSSLQKELDKMETEVSKSAEKLSSKKGNVSKIHGDFNSLKDDFQNFKKKVGGELDGIKNASAAYENLEKLKSELSSLKSSMHEIETGMKDVGGTLPEMESKIDRLSSQMEANEKSAKQMQHSIKEIENTSSKIKLEKDSAGRVDALLASKKDFEARLDSVQSKIDEALPLFENADKLILALSELKKKVASERKRLAEESGAIFSALDEEAENYSTFQKIKERASAKITEYSKSLEKVEADYERILKDVETAEKKFISSFTKFRESKEYVNMEKLSGALDSLMEKKRELEKVKSGIDALEGSAEKISRQVKLLAKEAELVELRGHSIPELQEKVKRVRQDVHESIALTES